MSNLIFDGIFYQSVRFFCRAKLKMPTGLAIHIDLGEMNGDIKKIPYLRICPWNWKSKFSRQSHDLHFKVNSMTASDYSLASQYQK